MQPLPNEVAVLRVPSELLQGDGEGGDESEEAWGELNKLEALKMASRALSRSLNFQPLNVSCWHDLALSFHYRYLAGEGFF